MSNSGVNKEVDGQMYKTMPLAYRDILSQVIFTVTSLLFNCLQSNLELSYVLLQFSLSFLSCSAHFSKLFMQPVVWFELFLQSRCMRGIRLFFCTFFDLLELLLQLFHLSLKIMYQYAVHSRRHIAL
jgi:hypothetical protein